MTEQAFPRQNQYAFQVQALNLFRFKVIEAKRKNKNDGIP